MTREVDTPHYTLRVAAQVTSLTATESNASGRASLILRTLFAHNQNKLDGNGGENVNGTN